MMDYDGNDVNGPKLNGFGNSDETDSKRADHHTEDRPFPEDSFSQSDTYSSGTYAPDIRNVRSHLDPKHTEDMSRRMRVPHQIRPYDEESSMFRGQAESFSKAAVQMSVPDRILVAGNERHVGYRENRSRELDFDDMLYGFRAEPSVLVQTPPRILTMNQYDFPTATGGDLQQRAEGPIIAPMSTTTTSDSHRMETSLSQQADRNMGSMQRLPKNYESALRAAGPATQSVMKTGLPDTPGTRLVIDLYKRVELLERENYHRYLREMVAYAAIIGFLALRGVSYFLKR